MHILHVMILFLIRRSRYSLYNSDGVQYDNAHSQNYKSILLY